MTKNVLSAVVSSSRFLFRHLFITWLSRLDVLKSKILDRKRCTFFAAMIGVTGHRLPLNAAACFIVATYYEMMKKDIIIIILLLLLDEDIIGVGCWRLHRSASQLLWDEWEEG